MKNKVGLFLMICGVLLITVSVALAIYNNVGDQKAGQSSARVMSLVREKGQSRIDGNEYIGYLTIPALDLELPVMSEWDYDRLKIAPCLYYGSVEDNHMVIAGHNYSKHFGHIDQLHFGDTVTFTDMQQNVFCYTVEAIETLGALDTDKMIHSDWELTLYTCNYSGTDRITVRCRRNP